MSSDLDLRMVPLALGAWLGAGIGVAVSPRHAVWMVAAAALISGATLVMSRRGGPGAAVATALGLAAAGVLVGGGSAALQAHTRAAGVIQPLVAERATVRATVTVRAPPQRVRTASLDGSPRWLVRVRATQVSGRGTAGASRAPLLVIGGAGWDTVRAGEHLAVRGRLEPTDPGDAAVAVLRPSAAPEVVEAPALSDRVIARVRTRFVQACDVLPDEPGGLLPGLVVGDTSQLPPELDQAMRTSGLTHLTAVSGANITLICGAVLVVLTKAGVRRLTRLAIAAVAMLAFVLVAGPEPSVLRAAAMGAVGLVALATARPGAGIPPLGLAVVVLVLVDPWLSRAAGFAMSVLATAGLVLLARPIAADLERVLPRWLALAVAVPVAAQVAVAPVSVLLTPALPVYTVPANLLVAPAIAPATVLGVIAAAIAPLALPPAQVVVWVAGWPVRWVVWIAHTAAGLPGSSLPWPEGVRGAVLVVLASVVVLAVGHVVLQRLPSTRWRDRRLHTSAADPGSSTAARSGAAGTGGIGPWRAVRWRPVAGVLTLAVLLCLWWPVARGAVTGWPPGDWQVAACSVGQGTAVAVRSGPDSAVLLDAGPDPQAVDSCLTRLGVGTLDLVVLSHFHADHVNGLPGAIRARPVGGVLVAALAEPNDRAAQVSRWLAAEGLTATVAGQGWSGAAGEVAWRVLSPRPPAESPASSASSARSASSSPAGPRSGTSSARGSTSSDGPASLDGPDANNASLVVLLQTASATVLSLGDAEDDGQRAALRAVRLERIAAVDVVLVAHHGSATQLAELYRAVAPRIAVISVGADNDYGHPAPSALRMLAGLDVPVVRTDQCGDAVIRADLTSVCRGVRGGG